MNDIPIMWASELKAAYPQKSGPVGWGSMKLLMALRRALNDSTWEQIIDGCKRYKAYCQASGKENTDFVQNPLRFIADGCYLEEFGYAAPKSKDERALEDIRKSDAQRMAQAIESGGRLVPALRPYPLESVGSFETRVAMAQRDAPAVRGDVRGLITDLASRMRAVK